MPEHQLDVVVLTWNKEQVTRDFMDSFLANTDIPCRLIIIDNASTDGTRDYLATLKSTKTCAIQVIFNDENKGFSRGMNQGIALSDASYVCLASNDLIFTKGWIEEILSVLEKNERIGLITPNSNNLGERVAPGVSRDAFASELRKKYGGVFAEAPFCVGFCMVIRRELAREVGGFSEEFSPYFFEDTDLSMKAVKAGYLIGVAKGAYVWHMEHASLNAVKEKEKERVFAKNKRTFEKKWGKMLRILFIVESGEEPSEFRASAAQLAREGNFVSVMVQDPPAAQPRDVLKILFKKKPYDVIIVKNKRAFSLLKFFGRPVMNRVDAAMIKKIKFGEKPLSSGHLN